MAHIKAGATLRDLQEYTTVHFKERGFRTTPTQECLLLIEEVGELAKAIRKESGVTTDPDSHVGNIAHELADVLWVTSAIANMYDIDLEQAFRGKEAINHKRTWS
ncbi:MAG: putative pyrophosphatase [Patescibacteria group bacterium]|nr:putative pyrophosphatase [Patescibacteria group bacterium]